MPRIRRRRSTLATILFGAIVVIEAAGTLVAVAGPYDSEIAALRDGIDDQESTIAGRQSHIAELESRLSPLDGEVADTDGLIGDGDRELGRGSIRIELAADRFVK
ncbi:MAG: hypothetical protein GY913_20880, partial [Proteobacteria bacterium]|nr:hypothetical protein [Pseudomonadota bacterium]